MNSKAATRQPKDGQQGTDEGRAALLRGRRGTVGHVDVGGKRHAEGHSGLVVDVNDGADLTSRKVVYLDVGEQELRVVRGGITVVEKAAVVVHDVERDAACVFVAGESQLKRRLARDG
jgi:hypothetical protein